MSSDVLIKKILILSANPNGTDKLRLDEEARDIKEGLRQSRERDRFIIDSEWAVRPRDVRRVILYSKPQIVHFSGHGSEDGGLAFENATGQIQLVQPEALAGLFKLFSEDVECVLLNACYSEIQASAISQHIKFVIGMSKEIGDRAAIEFAVGFYDALGSGCSVETAYEFGCNAIQMAGILEHLTPVLRRKNISLSSSNIDHSDKIASKKDPTNRSIKLESPSKITYEFVLSGSVNEISKQKLEAIVTHLQNITGDTSLTLIRVETGSIKLILEGSEDGFRQLEKLFEQGNLNNVEGTTVENVRILNLQPISSVSDVRFGRLAARNIHGVAVLANQGEQGQLSNVENIAVENVRILNLQPISSVSDVQFERLAAGAAHGASVLVSQGKKRLSIERVLEGITDGILILSERGEWIYHNHYAYRICQQLNQGKATALTVPAAIWQTCEVLIENRDVSADQPVVIESEIAHGRSNLYRIRVRWLTLDDPQRPYLAVLLEDRWQSSQNRALAEAISYNLSPRQTEVWLLRRAGFTYQQIATELYITINTVKQHLTDIRAKQSLAIEMDNHAES